MQGKNKNKNIQPNISLPGYEPPLAYIEMNSIYYAVLKSD